MNSLDQIIIYIYFKTKILLLFLRINIPALVFFFNLLILYYFRFLDMGDITSQLEMKNRLQCKSFQWFMDNVAFDMLRKYPELPPNLHWGEVYKSFI